MYSISSLKGSINYNDNVTQQHHLTILISSDPFWCTKHSHTHFHFIFTQPSVVGRAGIINSILQINYKDHSHPPSHCDCRDIWPGWQVKLSTLHLCMVGGSFSSGREKVVRIKRLPSHSPWEPTEKIFPPLFSGPTGW